MLLSLSLSLLTLFSLPLLSLPLLSLLLFLNYYYSTHTWSHKQTIYTFIHKLTISTMWGYPFVLSMVKLHTHTHTHTHSCSVSMWGPIYVFTA